MAQVVYRDIYGRFTSKKNNVVMVQGVKSPSISKKKSGKFKSSESKIMTTHYFLVLDNSSSMTYIKRATVDAFNERLASLRNESKNNPNHKFTITLITFDTSVHTTKYRQMPLHRAVDLNYHEYTPEGWTAMLDGIGQAVELARKITLGPNDAHLIEVITDGKENRSVKYGKNGKSWNYHSCKDFNRLLIDLDKEGVWTVVFQVPNGNKLDLHHKYGIKLNNINEWEPTESGTQEATQHTSIGFANYSKLRNDGKKSMDTFYLQADLSKVKPSDIQNLKDLSYQFKLFDVYKEQQIKEFVEEHSNCKYIIGSAYYEINSRDELIQFDKKILVMEKKKNKIYGGKDARKLLGLPEGVNIRLNPWNLGTFRVFVQSKSVNRVLVRNTRVLIDTHKWVHSVPTWCKLPKQI